MQLLANAHNGLAEEEPTKMNMKAIIAAVTFTAIAVPAFADAYFVVQGREDQEVHNH